MTDLHHAAARVPPSTKLIYITTQFEGFHRYVDAPREVAFLQTVHRHLFKVELRIEVEDDDRELEFFLVKKFLKFGPIADLESLLRPAHTNGASCEWMAELIGREVRRKYGARAVSVLVTEDGENGGGVAWDR